MFHEESLVTTVFKVINLGVFIAAAIYLFKKQLAPINQEIAKKKLDKTTLEQEGQLSDQQLAHMQLSLQEQKKWLQTMERNVAKWNQHITLLLQQKEQEKKEIRTKVAQKVEQQASYIHTMQIRNKVIPLALEQARNELEQMDKQQQQTYLKNLITFFKKGAHES